MEFDDEFIFIFSEIASFEVRPQVINPPEAATLATAEEAGGLGKRPPASFAVGPDVSDEPVIFFFGPCPFVVCAFSQQGDLPIGI